MRPLNNSVLFGVAISVIQPKHGFYRWTTNYAEPR